MSLRQPNGTERAATRNGEQTDTEAETAPGELLALLDADYSREILEAIRAEPMSARDLADACDASRPTIYRRLNDLQDAGLVDTAMSYDADGHHRTVFEATLDTLSVDVAADGLSVTVTTDESDRSETPPARARP